jgi:hypothetical protein
MYLDQISGTFAVVVTAGRKTVCEEPQFAPVPLTKLKVGVVPDAPTIVREQT